MEKRHRIAMEIKTSTLMKIFVRSLFIQSSFNDWRMQNLGFAFSMIPLLKGSGNSLEGIADRMGQYLQVFNTNPYFTGPIIGSVVRIETAPDDQEGHGLDLRNTLMGPYAAIGDPFFWGALRPCAAIAGVLSAILGSLLAPFFFLLLYSPFHVWVRGVGFWEGYRRGRAGIDFIRHMDLPRLGRSMRWLSLVMLGGLAALTGKLSGSPLSGVPALTAGTALLILILLCYFCMARGLSSTTILYAAVCIFVGTAVVT